MARHGGGAFSGKDPSKVDRSAAYAMRWVAKKRGRRGLADRCETQVAYAIGKAKPVGLFVECFGTEKVPVERIQDAVLRSSTCGARHHLRAGPAAADLLADCDLRPLRAYRAGLLVERADRLSSSAPRPASEPHSGCRRLSLPAYPPIRLPVRSALTDSD